MGARKRFSRVVLAVAAVLAATGPGPVPAAAAQAGPRADLVRIPFPQDDGSLTPYTFELGYSLMTLVYDTLLWRDADGVPQPWLARSVTPNLDGRQLTVRLVEGATWHDGQPVTAEDVAFTFRYMAGRAHPRFTAELRDVERVDVFDPTTLVISLRRPSPGFPDQPLADLPILPAHLWSGLAPDKAAPDGPAMGSGPYKMAEYRPGLGWRLEANAAYFKGRPAAEVLEVSVNRDATSTLEDFRQRRTDMVAVNLPRGAQAEVTSPGTRVARGPSYLGTILLFNTRQAPFDRPEARQAVARLVQPERLARVVGSAAAANRGYLHPDSAWAPDDLLLPAGPAADPGPAKQAVGGPVRVLVPDNDPIKIEAGRQVVQAMVGAGIDAELAQLRRDELVRAVGEDGTAPSFQAAIWSSPALASYDPVLLGRLFGSDPRDTTTNLSGYRSAAFDAAAARVAGTPDRAARQAAVDEALRTLATDVPVVPLFFAEGAYAFRPAVYDGWVFTKGTGILDKRSFVEPRRAAAAGDAAPTATEGGGGSSTSSFGWLALAAVGVAVVIGLKLVLDRRRERAGG